MFVKTEENKLPHVRFQIGSTIVIMSKFGHQSSACYHSAESSKRKEETKLLYPALSNPVPGLLALSHQLPSSQVQS